MTDDTISLMREVIEVHQKIKKRKFNSGRDKIDFFRDNAFEVNFVSYWE